jgi:hypothetical protein
MSLRHIAILGIFLMIPTTLRADLPRDFPMEAYDVVLVPLLTPPAFGAHGAEFRTLFTLENPTDVAVEIDGIRDQCHGGGCLPSGCDDYLVLLPHTAACPPYQGTPGRFLILFDGEFDRLAANLRVHDVSRNDQNFGTEIPIVRERELTTAPIHLPGVPVTAGFRNTLRIYGTRAASVRVTIGNQTTDIALTPGAGNFDPAYAISTAFPVAAPGKPSTLRVTVTPLDTSADAARIWAFVSVTNNETQLITTMTPQR